jgi:signal transduction histidine kinase
MGPLDIGAIVEEAVAVFRDTAKNRQIKIIVVNNISSLVTGNSTAVRQVLMNLLSNAVKYNRYGGKVWVTVEGMHDGIDISITDEGCGIPRDEIPKIFDKFYRAAGSEQIKGAGLGLYIVKLLIEAMGGKISAVSKPGVGSTFMVSFMKEKAEESERVSQVTPARGHETGPERLKVNCLGIQHGR